MSPIKIKTKVYPVNEESIRKFLNDIYSDRKDNLHDSSLALNEGDGSHLIQVSEIIKKLSEKIEYFKNPGECPKQFLRRKICAQLFKLLTKMASQVIKEEDIKKLVLDLEKKARLKDPLMGELYKNHVTQVFDRLKVIYRKVESTSSY